MAKVAINGPGRIGRATLKILMDTPGLDPGRLVRHHQRYPRVGCRPRHVAGRRW
jgi:hypothetical protein